MRRLKVFLYRGHGFNEGLKKALVQAGCEVLPLPDGADVMVTRTDVREVRLAVRDAVARGIPVLTFGPRRSPDLGVLPDVHWWDGTQSVERIVELVSSCKPRTSKWYHMPRQGASTDQCDWHDQDGWCCRLTIGHLSEHSKNPVVAVSGGQRDDR